VLRGCEATAQDDDGSRKIDPHQQRHHTAKRAVERVKVRDVFCVEHEAPLQNIQTERHEKGRDPDLPKCCPASGRIFIKHAEAVEEHERWDEQSAESEERTSPTKIES